MSAHSLSRHAQARCCSWVQASPPCFCPPTRQGGVLARRQQRQAYHCAGCSLSVSRSVLWWILSSRSSAQVKMGAVEGGLCRDAGWGPMFAVGGNECGGTGIASAVPGSRQLASETLPASLVRCCQIASACAHSQIHSAASRQTDARIRLGSRRQQLFTVPRGMIT